MEGIYFTWMLDGNRKKMIDAQNKGKENGK